MELARWNPFRELEDMQGRLNRLFGEAPFARTGRERHCPFPAGRPPSTSRRRTRSTSIKADLPDVKKEDVKVELLDGTLTIEGERQQEKEEKGKTFHKIEREYGKFLRRFAMPSEVDASKVQADFKNGVLNVHLPKSATPSPRRSTSR